LQLLEQKWMAIISHVIDLCSVLLTILGRRPFAWAPRKGFSL
jgi:hypothetical protein